MRLKGRCLKINNSMNLPKEFINILCCPKRICRGDLEELSKDVQIILRCLNCRTEYPVIDNIPILFPNTDYSQNFHQRHWNKEEQAKSYTKKYDGYLKNQGTAWGLYTHHSEMKAIDKLIKSVNLNLTGKTVLDCGCGNGRLLSLYPEAKIKIGIDASFYLLKETKKREPNFWLVCGQVEDLPFKDCIADFSVSVRVYQHLKTPEHAFSEMVRATHPSGWVSLEVYNKFNFKELYKRFRMLKIIDKLKPWGLSYDRYYSYREIEKWCQNNFIKPIKYVGAGWGLYFYLFDLIKFRRFAPEWLQKIVYGIFLWLEDIVGTWPIFCKTLEKVCFIGSLQVKPKRRKLLARVLNHLRVRQDIRRAKRFQRELEDRNYCFVGKDEHHLRLAINWLKRAQDATPDAGVSRGFSLVKTGKSNPLGWQPSYPETTGYIIPTMIEASKILNDPDLLRRAKLMADWELQIMFPDGAVHGGNICEKPNRAIFDTGQVIRGLKAIYLQTNQKKYLEAAIKSATWILENENNRGGKWTENIAKCVSSRATTYNIYAIVPIVELGIAINNSDFKALGFRTGQFTIKMQNENGWFKNCDFEERDDVLLHTIVYTIDGLWDMGVLLEENKFLSSAKLALDGVLSQMDNKGYIPGRLNSQWQGTVSWACLTGIAQIAVACLKVYKKEHEKKYLKTALLAKEFLKTCQNNLDETQGGGLGALWGSWPIWGEYGQYQALNWPVKYFADLLIEILKLNVPKTS